MNEYYRKFMKGKPGYDVVRRPYPDTVWTLGWQTGMFIEEILRLTLEKVPPDKLTGPIIRDYGIHRVKDYDFKGVKTPIHYEPNKDHRGSEHAFIYQVKEGKGVIVEKRKVPMILPPWMEKKG